MGKSCPNGTWFYSLLDNCVSCDKKCHQPSHPRCTDHCASKKCNAVRGHFYDLGQKKCIRCVGLCGRHPLECSQHCLTTALPASPTTIPTPTTTTTTLGLGRSQGHPAGLLPVSIPLLYSLMGLCVLVLLCILGLSLLVFLRTARKRATRPAKPGPTVMPQPEGGAQAGSRVDDVEGSGRGRIYKQPLYTCTSNPTESCECTHCFPDLRVPCREAAGEARLIYSLHQQTSSSFSSPQHSGTRWGTEEQGHWGGPRRLGEDPSL